MIKKIIFIGALIIGNICNAQINAITETGENVLLYKNGIWKYADDSLNIKTKILKNDKLFVKDHNSTFLVKSSKTNIGVWINPKKWRFSKSDPNSPSEYKFQLKDSDLYGMLIAEKTLIPLESLTEIAFQNAYDAAPDIKIVKKEYRNVNGLKVIMMQMKGTIKGIKFIYYGYYYSGKDGSFQFLTYTSQNLFSEYKASMEKLLNGLVEY
jgi:hypothetical protein